MKYSSLLPACVLAMLCVPSVGYADADTVRIMQLDSVRVRSLLPRRDITSVTPLQTTDRIRMRLTNVADLTDAFNHMAGVFLRDYGGTGGMKTVSVRGLGASHTGVTLDGISMTDVQTGQVDLSRYNMMDIESAELVVAEKTGLLQSARSASSSATIEFHTTPTDTASPSKHSLTLEQGSFGHYAMRLLWQQRLSGRWSIQAAGGALRARNDYPYTLTNGQQQTRERRINNRVGTYDIGLSSRLLTGGNGMLRAAVNWYDSRQHLPGQVVYYNPSNNEQQRDRAFLASLSWRGTLSPRWSLAVRGKWDWNECRYKDISDIYPHGSWTENYRQQEGYFSGVAGYAPSSWLQMAYAVDYFHNGLISNQSVNGSVSRHSLLQSLTAVARWPRLTLNGRIIYSRYINQADLVADARDYSHWNASAAASVRLLPREQLYLRTFCKGIFRLPTFTESYYYHLGNPDLSPEKTRQLGMGLSWQKRPASWWKLFACTLDAYFNRVSDKIVSVPMNLHQWRTVNIGEIRALGCDFTMESCWPVRPSHDVVLHASLSIQDVTDRTVSGSPSYGRQLAYIPRLSGSLSLASENPVLSTALSLTGCTHRWATHEHAPSTRLSGYAELTASLWRTLQLRGNRTLSVRLVLRNLCNKSYSVIKGYPMPGRSYRVAIGMNF